MLLNKESTVIQVMFGSVSDCIFRCHQLITISSHSLERSDCGLENVKVEFSAQKDAEIACEGVRLGP